jgi:outer membrane immunogenic protein
MMKSLLRLSLAAAALASVSTVALSADLEPEIRPPLYDWTGPYIGGFVSVVSLEGHYDKVPDCGGCTPVDPEMSGTGFDGGLLAGWNYDFGGVVAGIEGDWAWGGKIADNDEPAELTEVSLDDIATIRARIGMPWDATLFYVTGGVAFANVEFSGEVGPIGNSVNDSDDDWVTGWTIGGGIEHAFSEGLHGRLEYLYIDLPDADFRLEDPNGFGGDIEQHFQGIHTIRAALTYNFSL